MQKLDLLQYITQKTGGEKSSLFIFLADKSFCLLCQNKTSRAFLCAHQNLSFRKIHLGCL